MMLVVVVSYIWLEQQIYQEINKIMTLTEAVSYVRLDQLIRIAHEKRKTRLKTKYLFEIMMLVVLDYLLEIMMLVVYLFEIMMLVVMVSYLRLDRLICMAYLFEIKMLVVSMSYFWLDQLICIALFIYHK
ncbi:hypothetical protein DPMN_005149 [Dreissena polymorpha]|uniref:Uncharacterized protein n=1 Tax=Dreissena polymorpha TaxID=45954 RepID=A0A9D4MRL9_DREPO|nr:hypothetical protein DPMN_005149 [Dreissena polymorpha]